MYRTYISLGSNLGDRRRNLEKAIILLKERAGQIVVLSAVYETEPWGFTSDLNFYNQVLELLTDLEPMPLLETIHRIETDCGRVPSEARYAARPIDLDILFFNGIISKSADLILPHPRLHLRRFVLIPLVEIAPDMVHPLLKKNMVQLLKSCTDPCRIIQRLP